MSKIVKGGIFIVLFFSQALIAQNYYNSVYTRYLLGDLMNTGFSYNNSLGGSSLGLRPHNQINYLNPASYTTQDSSSFLFQAGFTGRSAKVFNNIDKDRTTNFNLDYLAIGFPVAKSIKMSVGAVPFSRAQFNSREEVFSSEIGDTTRKDYTSFGGYNEVYIGGSIEIKKIASIGFNASYLFGSVEKKNITSLPGLLGSSAMVEQIRTTNINDFYYKLGAQLYPTYKEKHKVILGLTYDFKKNIDLKQTTNINRFNVNLNLMDQIDSIMVDSVNTSRMVYPSKIGIGLTYVYDNMLTVTAEYTEQDWSDNEIAVSEFKIGKYQSYRFGVDYTPVSFEKRLRVGYLKRMSYRAGAYYTKSYLIFNNDNIFSYGFSVGIGLPLKYMRKLFTGSALNIGYQYGVRGTTDNGLIKEEIQVLTFGVTLHDFWFLKPKYD